MVAGKLEIVENIPEECYTEGEVDDFLIHRDDDEPEPEPEISEKYKLMITDNNRCNYLCGSKGVEEDMNQRKSNLEYVSSDDPRIDYSIVNKEELDDELEIDKKDTLSFMNIKTIEEGEAWYRKNFPKIPEDLYPIMARWNWGDLKDITKKDVKNDKKRVKKGKKPKNCGLEVRQGNFIVEF